MKIYASTHSNLPRIGATRDEQKLRRAYASLEKKKIDDTEFREIQDNLVRELIGIQQSSGCEIVTDGMVRWYDHLSHFAGRLKNVEINGLLRFFDTNYYFRQAVIGDNPDRGQDGMSEEIAFTAGNSATDVKAVIPGPYTLAKLSQNKTSLDFDALCIRLAEIIREEIGGMAVAGAKYIQIEEPSFARDSSKTKLFKDCVKIAGEKRGDAKIVLALYFGDCTPLLDTLADTDADIFGLDFPYSPGLFDRLAKGGFSRPISFGILDGRNTRMEDPRKIADSLKVIIDKAEFDECHITTSCGLEFLPRQYAIRKLELTGRLVELLGGN